MNLRNWFEKTKKNTRILKNKFCSPEDIFTNIYKKEYWSGINKSGSGSDLIQTIKIRKELPNFLQESKILSMLDLPCGDFFWMREINLDFISYIGGDIVPQLITKNNAKYSSPKRKFILMNILEDPLPKVDLVFCRDLFGHLSYGQIHKALSNLKKSNSTFLLTTSFMERVDNRNITTGDWRPINLMKEPFNFPNPLKVINENCTEGDGSFLDKSLCLWRINEVPN